MSGRSEYFDATTPHLKTAWLKRLGIGVGGACSPSHLCMESAFGGSVVFVVLIAEERLWVWTDAEPTG